MTGGEKEKPGEEEWVITDADLHAWLLGEKAGRSWRTLAGLVHDVLSPAGQWHAAAFLHKRADRCDEGGWPKLAAQTFNVCPHNLAERFFEAMFIYRAAGHLALPEMLPLAQLLLEADIHGYFVPTDKPYRDHLPHQTRVAALAHLLLEAGRPDGPTGLLPDSWQEHVRAIWPGFWNSAEGMLLHEYGVRTGLVEWFPGQEELPDLAACAALLAGLMHDLGYLLKVRTSQGADPDAVLKACDIFPAGYENRPLPPFPMLELYRLCFQQTEPGRRFQDIRHYILAHPESPHSLAGALWLALLPSRLRRDGRRACASRKDKPRQWGRLEFVCQLAALMALVHDFPLESEEKKKEQQFKEPPLPKGKKMAEAYPLSAVFALADTLNEFGRPVVFTNSRDLRAYPAVLALHLMTPDEGAPPSTLAFETCRKHKILSCDPQKPRIEIFWEIGGSGKDAPPAPGSPDFQSCFDPFKVGEDVPDRLEAWGFGKLFCQRSPRALRKVENWNRKEDPLKEFGLRKMLQQPDTVFCPDPAQRERLAYFPLCDYSEKGRRIPKALRVRPLDMGHE